jgi:hypothetical protein
VIELGDHDLVTRLQEVTECQADHPNKGGGVESKDDLRGLVGIQERRNALASMPDDGVYLLGQSITATPLHVVVREMTRHRVDEVRVGHCRKRAAYEIQGKFHLRAPISRAT